MLQARLIIHGFRICKFAHALKFICNQKIRFGALWGRIHGHAEGQNIRTVQCAHSQLSFQYLLIYYLWQFYRMQFLPIKIIACILLPAITAHFCVPGAISSPSHFLVTAFHCSKHAEAGSVFEVNILYLKRPVSKVHTKPIDRKLRGILFVDESLLFPAFSFEISQSLA